MTADTPTPYTPPDGVILTTMREARKIGHGVIETVNTYVPDDAAQYWDTLPEADRLQDDELVWWRPTPERTVTIELPESVARALARGGGGSLETQSMWRCACRDAITRLDGDT